MFAVSRRVFFWTLIEQGKKDNLNVLEQDIQVGRSCTVENRCSFFPWLRQSRMTDRREQREYICPPPVTMVEPVGG